MADPRDILSPLADLLRPNGLLRDPAARLVYSRDSSHMTLGRPLAVALPEDVATLRNVVRYCAAHGLPIVTRGTGTGLSGGAVPNDGEIVLATARLNEIDKVDETNRRVRTGVGVLNDRVSVYAASSALHFAPDPSSQSASSIGGNIAENAGGPHCLRHGVTLQHLLRLEWCDIHGRALTTGRGLACERGIDLTSLLCGSEGTLGIITAADLKLVPNPPSVATLAAFFPALDDATGSVTSLLGAGLLPVAIEMVDQPMLEAVEAAFGFGFPTDVAAAMILEFAGSPEETAEDSKQAQDLLSSNGAREIRVAEDEATRLELWKCRKKAFGAVGRLAPAYVTMDVVVPLGSLSDLVREIQVIKAKHGVEIATTFHAGDGNLHPGVHYDDRDPKQCKAAHAAADEIMRVALSMGGSVTGEHGIGIEKLHAATWQLDNVSLDVMWDIKAVFDPENCLNPGKALPARGTARDESPPPPSGCSFSWDSLTVTAAADVSLAELQAEALERNLWLPVGLSEAVSEGTGPGLGRDRTIGSVVEHILHSPTLLAGGSARDYLLEHWAETGDGRLLHAGAPVFKNVAGYNLAQMLCGSGRVLATAKGATFQLRPAPEMLGVWRFGIPVARAGIRDALQPVLHLLATRDTTLGGPVCVVDKYDEGTGSITILAPGRDRIWDLGELDTQLRTGLASAGMALIDHDRVPFGCWRKSLKLLPDWARSQADWTVSTRRSSIQTEKGESSDNGERQNLLPPEPWNRLIWQAAPRLVWRPGTTPETTLWYSDHCYTGGYPTPLPETDLDVPQDLLVGLKRLFDPEGRLDNPPWLEEATHG